MATDIRIDSNLVLRLLSNASIVELLPPLQELVRKRQKTVKKKSCCAGTTNQGLSLADRDTAVRNIGNILDGDRGLVAELKKRLRAEVLRTRNKKVVGKGYHERKY